MQISPGKVYPCEQTFQERKFSLADVSVCISGDVIKYVICFSWYRCQYNKFSCINSAQFREIFSFIYILHSDISHAMQLDFYVNLLSWVCFSAKSTDLKCNLYINKGKNIKFIMRWNVRLSRGKNEGGTRNEGTNRTAKFCWNLIETKRGCGDLYKKTNLSYC